MFTRLLAICLCLLLVQALPSTAGAESQTSEDYVLDRGDALHINLTEQPGLLSDNFSIRPDGKINLPLVGEVQVAGMTVPKLIADLTRMYSQYFVTPHISINIVVFRPGTAPIQISIFGHVLKSGPLEFRKPPTLVDAIALAGGFAERADRNSIRIYNKIAGGAVKTINLNQILQEGRINDVILKNGDVIEVPKEGWPDFYQLAPVILGVASVIISIISITRR